MDNKRFWDKAAKKYAASPIKDTKSYEHTLARTQSYLTATDTVLEVGCGTGSTALEIAPHVADMTATDISPEMIAIAQAKATGLTNITFLSMPVQDALSQANQIDVVLGFNLFHLVENAEGAFAAIHKALRPGGLFISKTACLSEPSIGLKRFAFAGLIPIMRALRVAPFVRRFTFAQLESAIETAGFELLEVGSFPAMSRYIVARRV